MLHCGSYFWIKDPSLIGHRASWKWKCSSHALARPINHCGICFGRLCMILLIYTIPKICIICNTATLHIWKNGSNLFPEMKLDSEIWLCEKRQFTSICCSTITLNTLWSDQIKARRYKGCCKSGNHSLISSSTQLTPHYHWPAMLGATIRSHQPEASSFELLNREIENKQSV